jgi:hypothetical protein
MTRWKHKVEVRKASATRSAQTQQEEIGTLQAKLNALGAEGWALVPYEAVPMTRTITNNIGYAYLSLFKGSGDSS